MDLGFSKPPTNFYPQPFWTYWTKEHLDRRNCLGNIHPVPKVFLEQIERFIVHCDSNNLKYFAMTMLIRTTHDKWESAEMADQFYESFLKRNAVRLNNTVVIMMGDHGDRYSEEMMFTSWGQIESKLPLMVLRMPHSLLRTRPIIEEMLRRNEHRLSTVIDVHKAMVELTKIDDLKKDHLNKSLANNSNLFYSVINEEIPFTRTCAQARIKSDEYCACEMKPVRKALNHTLVQPLAEHLVAHLNSLLPADKCQPLGLIQIESAVWHEPEYWAQHLYRKEQLELTVQVSPGAIVRGQLTRSLMRSWSITQQERLNKPSEPSGCIEDVTIKPFCFCIANQSNPFVANVTVQVTKSVQPNTSIYPNIL